MKRAELQAMNERHDRERSGWRNGSTGRFIGIRCALGPRRVNVAPFNGVFNPEVTLDALIAKAAREVRAGL